MTSQEMKQAALKAVQGPQAALKAAVVTALEDLAVPELSTGKEDETIKHARGALAAAVNVLQAEEEWIGLLMLKGAQTPNDGTPGPLDVMPAGVDAAKAEEG